MKFFKRGAYINMVEISGFISIYVSILYSYKFSRDVYFVDATNLAFSRFYFRGSQDFVFVDYVRTIIKYKFSRT